MNLNMAEWLSSKKTKDMLTTQLILAVVAISIVALAKGDPEKAKALVAAIENILLMIAGLGGVTIAGQAHVDAKKAKEAGAKEIQE